MGLTTYIYRGYNPFTKYHGHPSCVFSRNQKKFVFLDVRFGMTSVTAPEKKGRQLNPIRDGELTPCNGTICHPLAGPGIIKHFF